LAFLIISQIAAERAKKHRKLVLRPVYISYHLVAIKKAMAALKRIRDLAVEAAIAIALVGGFTAYLWTHPRGTDFDWKWIALMGNTATVFGFVIWWFRDAWATLVFWAGVLVLMVGHLAIYSFALRRIDNLPLAYYSLFNVAEWALVVPTMRWLTRWDSKRSD
jgi:hypothetical protein